MKKVSIIIPCYNASECVYESWKSVKEQTMDLSEIECIFVDDASTDNGLTWEMLSRIECEAPESVKIIHSDDNRRQGGARNIGLEYVEGEYLLFLDADDTYRADTCESLYHKAVEGNYDLIQSRHHMTGELGSRMSPSKSQDTEESYDLSDDATRTLFLINAIGDFGCTNKFYRSALVKSSNVRFAEHVVYEEPLFVYPLFAYADKVLITSEEYYQYNLHEGSTMTSRLGKSLMDHPNVQLQLIEDMISRKSVFEKNYYAIMLHFLHSYYAETILFARINRGDEIELDYINKMRGVCLALFPDYASNPLVPLSSRYIQVAIDSIAQNIDTKERLKVLTDELVAAYYAQRAE